LENRDRERKPSQTPFQRRSGLRIVFLALPHPEILPSPSQVVAEWIHLLGRHSVEGAGVFDLQIIARMLANGVHDGIDALSLAS
jgi:hypothetical protein